MKTRIAVTHENGEVFQHFGHSNLLSADCKSKIGESLRDISTGRSPCAAMFVLFHLEKLPYTKEQPGA